MSSKLAKIQGFVDSLEKNYLSEKQQMTIAVNPEEILGGTGSSMNKKDCMNNSSICESSTNKKDCMNGASFCTGTINKSACTNNLVDTTILR